MCRFLLKVPGGGSPGGRRAEGPGGCLRRTGEFFFGGGVNIYFRGPKCPPRTDPVQFKDAFKQGPFCL